MRILILALAWLTPPVIGGFSGWSGIWGGGSAFTDYIIPVPVAGGALHVPSFVALVIFISIVGKMKPPVSRFMAPLAFCVAAFMVGAMLEFDRLSAWLFTDYQPASSPFRLDPNPLFLFFANDAFWGGLFALKSCHSVPSKAWWSVPLAPVLLVAVVLATQLTSGPQFEMGSSMPGNERGEEITMVYTSSAYDEAVFRNWLESRSFAYPWNNINTEHQAVIFTSSMQAVKWGISDPALIQGSQTIGTICLFEEDQAIIPYRGFHDCFADRESFDETIARLLESDAPGLGRNIDYWYAQLRLCDDVDMEQISQDLVRPSRCEGLYSVYRRDLDRYISLYGEESPQVEFVREEAEARGL